MKKSYSFSNWNKNESYSSEKFKPYKIGYDTNTNQFYVKNTSHIVIEANGEDHEMIFPPYETKIIENLTGIKAKEKENE